MLCRLLVKNKKTKHMLTQSSSVVIDKRPGDTFSEHIPRSFIDYYTYLG